MKIKLILISLLGISSLSLMAFDVTKVDVKSVCDVKKNGVNKVLENAAMYNKEAKAAGLEFMRLGMKTSQYIQAAQEAVKNGAKNVDTINAKKKKTGVVTTEYAAWRGCSFALRALQQNEEAKITWRLAVPGDGYEY